MQACIAIDWLGLHVNVPIVKSALGESKGYQNIETKYHIELQEYGTRHFKDIYLIYDRPGGEEVATLSAHPHHGDWGEQFGILKLNNKYLYQKNLKEYTLQLLRDLSLEFVNITRLDIAYDFNEFANNLNPKNFIKNYVSGKYIKTGKTKGKTQGKDGKVKTDIKTKRYLIEKLQTQLNEKMIAFEQSLQDIDDVIKEKIIAAKRQADEQIIEDYRKDLFYNLQYVNDEEVVKIAFKNNSGLSLEYLKFGTEVSPISYMLYNKTTEMADKKIKPWIQDHWKSYGWDGKDVVWRIEFSFKSSTKGFIDVDPDTGEMGNDTLHFKDLSILDRVKDIFDYHYKKYFVFVYDNGTRRKDRMKQVALLRGIESNLVKIELSDKREGARADKIFTKKMMELNQELRGQDFELSIFTNDLLSYIVYYKGLKTWFESRYPAIVISEDKAVEARKRGYYHSQQGYNYDDLILEYRQKEDEKRRQYMANMDSLTDGGYTQNQKDLINQYACVNGFGRV